MNSRFVVVLFAAVVTVDSAPAGFGAGSLGGSLFSGRGRIGNLGGYNTGGQLFNSGLRGANGFNNGGLLNGGYGGGLSAAGLAGGRLFNSGYGTGSLLGNSFNAGFGSLFNTGLNSGFGTGYGIGSSGLLGVGGGFSRFNSGGLYL